jgi:2-polyprenyl-3-methyl-5-hydroxy-6-metoxy-1,4-benzoquinol methylase
MNFDQLPSINKALSIILDPAHQEEYIPWFWEYCGHLSNKRSIQKMVQTIVDDFNLAQFVHNGKVILDAGCGFGIKTLTIRLMGAKEVHGIDHYEPMMVTFQKWLTFLPNIKGVIPKLGDVVETGYADNTFDFIYSNEAVSHYFDIPGFMREMYRVLKAGGILFISDYNNGANPLTVWKTKKLWHRFENGPAGEFFGIKVEQPYAKIRQQIITQAFTNLREEEVNILTRGTFSLNKKQILNACEHYITSGEKPVYVYHYGQPPIHPLMSEYIERLIHPGEISRQLENIGFSNRVYAYIGGGGGNRLLRGLNGIVETMSPFSWPIGRAIKVVAKKE